MKRIDEKKGDREAMKDRILSLRDISQMLNVSISHLRKYWTELLSEIEPVSCGRRRLAKDGKMRGKIGFRESDVLRRFGLKPDSMRTT